MCVDLSKKSPTFKTDFSSFFSNCSIFTPPKKTSLYPATMLPLIESPGDSTVESVDHQWWLRLFSWFSPVKRWYLLFRLTHQSTTVSNAVRTFSLEPMHDVVKRIYTCEPIEVYLVCNVYNTWQKNLLTKKQVTLKEQNTWTEIEEIYTWKPSHFLCKDLESSNWTNHL